MEPKAKEIRRQQWKKIITNCNNSGMNKTQWCRENGISDKSFFYYQKILRDEMIEQAESDCSLPSFVDVTTQIQAPGTFETSNPTLHLHGQQTQAAVKDKPDLIIRKGELTFEISNTISPALLRVLGGILDA